MNSPGHEDVAVAFGNRRGHDVRQSRNCPEADSANLGQPVEGYAGQCAERPGNRRQQAVCTQDSLGHPQLRVPAPQRSAATGECVRTNCFLPAADSIVLWKAIVFSRERKAKPIQLTVCRRQFVFTRPSVHFHSFLMG